MRRFWVFLFTLTAALHVPFVVVTHELGKRFGSANPGIWAAFLTIAAIAAFYGRIELASADRPISALRRLAIEEPYYVHWCALVFTLPLWLLASAFAMTLSLVANPSLIPTSGAMAVWVYALGLCIASYGVFVRRRWLRVRTIDVPIRGLPSAFINYRIAHLSDLHIGALTPRERMQAWSKTVGDLDVDLVALTGDYVTSGTTFHETIASELGALPSRDGCIAVMGNHDYFGDGDPLVRLMREAGIDVLRNERMTIERDGQTLEIAGIDDTWTRRANIGRALGDRKSSAPLIVLAHDPQLFPDLARRGASLVLSGHTHWGQVALPFFATTYNLSARVYRYHADVYEDGDATLYISPGLGTTGPPIRLGAAPEITVLRLVAR